MVTMTHDVSAPIQKHYVTHTHTHMYEGAVLLSHRLVGTYTFTAHCRIHLLILNGLGHNEAKPYGFTLQNVLLVVHFATVSIYTTH